MPAFHDDFIFEDDFDAIMAVLDENEELDEYFEEAVEEVQSQGVACNLCPKICKSQRGLNRHITVKHNNHGQDDSQLEMNNDYRFTADVLNVMVNETKMKIVKMDVFANTLKEEITRYQPHISEDSTTFIEIQSLFNDLIKTGKAEKFYAKFYSEIALKSTKYFDGLSRNSATLLSTKLADRLLNLAKESSLHKTRNSSNVNVELSLSDNELAGLQYLEGYVLQNLHNKHKTSNSCKSTESQQAMSLLHACKEDADDLNTCNSQRLITSINRGGLWSPTKAAQQIFLKTEQCFRNGAKVGPGHRIDIEKVIKNSIQNIDVVSSLNEIVSKSALVVNSSVSKDTLHCMIHLYVRVRSFSFSKDIIQKYKIQQKQLKQKPSERKYKDQLRIQKEDNHRN